MENSRPQSDLATAHFPASTTDPTAPSIVPELPGVTYSDSVIAVVEPIVSRTLRSPPRSVARRVAARFVLGVAASALYVAWIRTLSEAPRETPVLRGTTEPAKLEPAVSTAAIPARALQQTPPPWFSPQLLYVPTWMPASSDAPRAGVPCPCHDQPGSSSYPSGSRSGLRAGPGAQLYGRRSTLDEDEGTGSSRQGF
jgi:hypothetical protein